METITMEPVALSIAELPKFGGPRLDRAYKEIKAGRLIARKGRTRYGEPRR
jgi:hypothetical protein